MRTTILEHRGFILFASLLTLFRLIYISLIPITPQEAYYYYYSVHPALSYFDHPPLTAYSILLVKMNWLLPGYLGFILASASVAYRPGFFKSMAARSGLYSSIVLIVVAHGLFLIPNLPLGEGNTWSGWKNAATEIAERQQQYGGKENCFVFANSYKAAALLRFYLPEEQEVYAQNVYGKPALQFDIWGIPDSLSGRNAIYVFDDRREYKSELGMVSNCFHRLNRLERLDYRFGNSFTTRSIYLYSGWAYERP